MNIKILSITATLITMIFSSSIALAQITEFIGVKKPPPEQNSKEEKKVEPLKEKKIQPLKEKKVEPLKEIKVQPLKERKVQPPKEIKVQPPKPLSPACFRSLKTYVKDINQENYTPERKLYYLNQVKKSINQRIERLGKAAGIVSVELKITGGEYLGLTPTQKVKHLKKAKTVHCSKLTTKRAFENCVHHFNRKIELLLPQTKIKTIPQ